MGIISSLPQDIHGNKGWPWDTETASTAYSNFNFWPKISIITPSLNQVNFLEETIRSILLQNYPNLEFIIIDGGSTDGSIEVIKKYEKWITYWISEKDNGQSHAINKGLLKISGTLFNWINSDDILAPSSLLHIGMSYLKKPTLAICGLTSNFDEKSKQISVTYAMGVKENAENTFCYPLINQPGTFYHSSVILEIGLLNESLHFIMDLEFWRRFIGRFGISNIRHLNSQICFFRYHSQSKSTLQHDNFAKETILIDLYISKLLKFPDFYINWLETLKDPRFEYKPSIWFFDNVNVSQLKFLQLRDFLIEQYNQGNRSECKKNLKVYPGLKIPFRDIRFLKLYIKVILLPKQIEAFVRFIFRLFIK